jgi:hypothetical protein
MTPLCVLLLLVQQIKLDQSYRRGQIKRRMVSTVLIHVQRSSQISHWSPEALLTYVQQDRLAYWRLPIGSHESILKVKVNIRSREIFRYWQTCIRHTPKRRHIEARPRKLRLSIIISAKKFPRTKIDYSFKGQNKGVRQRSVAPFKVRTLRPFGSETMKNFSLVDHSQS